MQRLVSTHSKLSLCYLRLDLTFDIPTIKQQTIKLNEASQTRSYTFLGTNKALQRQGNLLLGEDRG
jgi:hypothetical protein